MVQPMIVADDIKNMVNHWMSTPAGGYFGQSYGSDIKRILLRQLSAANADEFIKKIRQDIPVLTQIPSGDFSILTEPKGDSEVIIYLFIGQSIQIEIGRNTPQTTNQEYYDVRAR